jgi:hypothetical protein
MELALLIALVASNLGWLAYMNKRDVREQAERDKLATRIQAPQAAPFIVEGDPKSASVPSWDDEKLWEASAENHGGSD